MKRIHCRSAASFVVAIAVVATTSQAHAQTVAEAACRDAIAKNLGKFVAVTLKDHATCHKKRSSGKLDLTTDCNDVFAIPANKSSDAYAKAVAAILAACPSSLTDVLAQYTRCPSPHSTLDDDGASAGIDDFTEATDCLMNLAVTLVNGASATVLGRPAAVLNAAAEKCQRAIGKTFRKHIMTIAKTRRSCQAEADQGGGGLQYSCATWDDGKIAKNLLKMESLIGDACDLPQDEVITLRSCGQTPAQLDHCVGVNVATVLGGGLVAIGYELPDTCKLGHAVVFINAGMGEQHTVTNFDVGYNGLGHDVDLLDGFEGAVDLACDGDCTNCAVTIDTIKERNNSFCRCDSDPTIHCDTISGPDADDCGGGNCTCTFGPPLALSAAQVPTCVVNKLTSELVGVADGGTGVATVTVTNTAVVHMGISQTQPCPLCVGDAAPNDGVRGGVCSGGTRNGLTCDQNGNSPDFGAISYDCQPAAAENISGTGLRVMFDLTSMESPAISTGLTQNSIPVFCLQCSGDTSVGCSSDADCAALGIGTCTANTGPQAHANACVDGICTATSNTETGSCEANEVDSFCDGFVRRSGLGLLPCVTDGDCDAYSSECPGGNCGNCALYQFRSCLPDPFGAIGTHGYYGSTEASGVYGSDMVSTFCIAATQNIGVNSSVGLPGPGRLLINFDFEGRCASDDNVPFELPGGSSCP
ncbi:MAG: hypothetical protein HY899_14700 [Deltaproteobacteria bacterium]|nr:hypothetical protein [Deltaproteobacteria bacterium]